VKINTKIIGILIISFLVISVLFSFASINTLKRSQTENIRLFKAEFLELAGELFENSSNLFYHDFDVHSIENENQTASQVLLDYLKEIDPQGKNTVVINIIDKQFLEGYNNTEIATILDQSIIENYLQENILNQKKDFDLDNFDKFTLDTTNIIAPSKIHLRIYNDAGFMVGYYKTFSTAKVRIQFIERQNEMLYNSYLLSSSAIFISIVVIVTIITILFMQNIIIKPLKILAFGLKQVQEGNLETKLDVRKKDEMGKIAVAFNSMTSDLKKSTEELEGKVKERTKELETKNLEQEKLNQELLKKYRDIEGMNKVMIDREMKMIELKKKVAAMSKKYEG
jgi:methyl-accepting chemotaxis protein